MHKNSCSIMGLTKGRWKFTSSDFPPREKAWQDGKSSHVNTQLFLYVNVRHN